MSSFGVVLDACVLIPASLRDTLLRATVAGLYKIQLTDDILEEVRRNLVFDIDIPEYKAEHLINTIRKRFHFALITHHTSLIEAMPINPKDRHVLAAAVACKAQIIVTQNLKDFPNELLTPFQVKAQSPDEFLTKLFLLEPDRMAEVVKNQANSLRNPPRSVSEVLATLAQHAPNFVWLVDKKIDNSQY
jgi:predicted nucleic acid-binding protein